MGDKKRKQHYVFQAYLKAWTEDNKIWCARAGKLFNPSTLNVAQERDFYRIKPLNDDERSLYNLLLPKNIHPDAKKALGDHIDTYLEPIKMQNTIKTIKQKLESQFNGNECLPKDIKLQILEVEKTLDIGVNNMEEDYYSYNESDAVKWIISLKKKDSDFYYTSDNEDGVLQDEKFEFLFFICEQYFRTKAIKERWLSNVNPILNKPQWKTLNIPKENINFENLVHHVFWFCKSSCAHTLRKNNAHLTILYNETDIPFITSDQPIINLEADYDNIKTEATKLIFYYPITPNIAITINDNNNEREIKISKEQVDEYNWLLVNSSYESIFANCKKILERYDLG